MNEDFYGRLAAYDEGHDAGVASCAETIEALEARLQCLQDVMELRDAAVKSLCIAIHGKVIKKKTIYDLIIDAQQLRDTVYHNK